MSRMRAVLLGLAAWLAVVAVGSTAVWLVISRAGQDVGAATQPPLRAVATASPGPEPSDGRTHPHPGHHSSSAPPTLPSRSASPEQPATNPPSPAAPSPQSSPATQRRVWQGTGGVVTAQCRGADISLVGAQPYAGFAVEVGNRGPEQLEVKFEGREDESGRQTELRAVCVGGVPRFTSQSESEGGD